MLLVLEKLLMTVFLLSNFVNVGSRRNFFLGQTNNLAAFKFCKILFSFLCNHVVILAMTSAVSASAMVSPGSFCSSIPCHYVTLKLKNFQDHCKKKISFLLKSMIIQLGPPRGVSLLGSTSSAERKCKKADGLIFFATHLSLFTVSNVPACST